MIIYMATNLINNKKYIGQTTRTLEERQKQHERAYRYKSSKNNIISRAINKYGKENFSWEVIDTAETIEELNTKEEYWISYHNTLKENGCGYNDKKGGNNHTHSQRTKDLIGIAQLGIKNHMYGKTGSDNPTSKRVVDIYTDRIYPSATECSKETGISVTKVCAVCRGDRGSANNRVFRYIDDNDNIIEPNKQTKAKGHRIVNVDSGEIFTNVQLAVLSKGKKSKSHLSHALKENNGVCYMYQTYWCYEGTSIDEVNLFKKQQHTKKEKGLRVKEINTGQIFTSISECSRILKINKGNLANKLKLNGIYKNAEYEIVKI